MPVAQLVEHSPFKGVVLGSNPSGHTKQTVTQLIKQFLNMKFYEKLGPYQKKEDLEKKKDINPNVARNWVITWYSIVAASIILYFVISNI